MPKRDHHLQVKCAEPGCKEVMHYTYGTQKELSAGYNKHIGKTKCLRHSEPEKTLSLTNLKQIKELVAGKSVKFPDLKELFWSEGSGFNYSDAHRAYAKDFPEGTILKITAEIILPNNDKQT